MWTPVESDLTNAYRFVSSIYDDSLHRLILINREGEVGYWKDIRFLINLTLLSLFVKASEKKPSDSYVNLLPIIYLIWSFRKCLVIVHFRALV